MTLYVVLTDAGKSGWTGSVYEAGSAEEAAQLFEQIEMETAVSVAELIVEKVLVKKWVEEEAH